MMRIAIITTRHWSGDPRLGRHASYLRAAGHEVRTYSYATSSRFGSLVAAGLQVLRTDARAMIFPDPDFFVVGSTLARLRGRRPVVDIHEDYPKTAMNRSWIPAVLKPIVSLAARSMVAVGRFMAWRVIVAAPQLGRTGDAIVLNIPDPSGFLRHLNGDEKRLVYVGDVTIARGALEMIETLARLPPDYHLTLVGPIGQDAKIALDALADAREVTDRVAQHGRQEHSKAWEIASHCRYGLSLLHDTPAYREAVATKLWEYMASGLIPVVSDLPGQRALISSLDPDLACSGPEAVASTILRLERDPDLVRELSAKAVEVARANWDEARPDQSIQAVFEP